MRLFSLTCLVMVAFAANSILNRMALTDLGTGPAAFALMRVFSGAATLALLASVNAGALRWIKSGSIAGAGSLATYVLGFSFAYVSLDTGVGALVLFGGVQITMFAGAIGRREAVPLLRWVGAVIAFLGLAYLFWPSGASAPDLMGVLVMALAAIGWGYYSLLGRKTKDPLAATASNFVFALPLAILCFAIFPDDINMIGAQLAIVSGALTSGVGYALWYTVLPRLNTGVAANAQMSVPLIAALGGLALLGEPLTPRFLIASMLVLGGVALSLRR